MKKTIILSLLLLSLLHAKAQDHRSDSNYGMRNHVILAFDESGNKWRKSDPKVLEYVKYFLYDNGGNPLLKENDYLSIVGIIGDCNNPTWQIPIYIKTSDSSKPMAFIPNMGGENKAALDTMWNRIVECEKHFEESYSLLSIAKPYMIAELGKVPNKPMVDNTYIICVTDHQYNGSDFYNELNYFLTGYVDKKFERGSRNVNVRDVLQVCYDVEREYCIEYSDCRTWIVNTERHVELFKVTPNHQSLTLPAVVKYKPTIEASLHRDGSYQFLFDIKPYNDHFEVLELNIYLETPDSEELIGSYAEFKEFPIPICYKTEKDSLHLRLEGTIKLNDGKYGATRLSYDHIKGLTQQVVIKSEPRQMIFHMVDMPLWMWVPWAENQFAAVGWAESLIVVLILIIFVIYISIAKTYKPKKEDISIKFYD